MVVKGSQRYRCAAAALLVVAALGTSVSMAAEGLSADKIKVSTPVYQNHASDFSPALGTYLYEVTWQGIPAAKASVSVEREGPHLKIATEVKTYRAIDLFYRLRYHAMALISAINLLPYYSEYKQRENSKVKETKISFLPNGEIVSVRRKKGEGEQQLRFDPNNFTLDPFSAAFLARSLPWDDGETKYFDTFEGKSRYLIALTAVDKIKVNVNGRSRDAWVISPKVEKLGQEQKIKKLRDARIYLTADNAREILKIESEVFIGTVKTAMTSFAPSTKPVPGTSMAKHAPAKTYLK